MYTKKDCTGEQPMNTDLKGRFIILKPSVLTDEYNEEQYQLVKCIEDLKLYVTEANNNIQVEEIISNPKKYKIKRSQVLGIAKDSVVINHKHLYCEV